MPDDTPDTDAQILASIKARNRHEGRLRPDSGVEVLLDTITGPDGNTEYLLHWGDEMCHLSAMDTIQFALELCANPVPFQSTHTPTVTEFEEVQDGDTEPTRFWTFCLSPLTVRERAEYIFGVGLT